MLVFLAHFLNFSKKEIEEMSFEEISHWFKEASNLYQKMNAPHESND
ncbi:hypothetical protein IJE86_11495 [bacterium]|nr:hypothetical protein [bacterium]